MVFTLKGSFHGIAVDAPPTLLLDKLINRIDHINEDVSCVVPAKELGGFCLFFFFFCGKEYLKIVCFLRSAR